MFDGLYKTYTLSVFLPFFLYCKPFVSCVSEAVWLGLQPSKLVRPYEIHRVSQAFELLANIHPSPGQEAEQAIQCLNGKLALSKKLVVRWAHAQVKVSLVAGKTTSSSPEVSFPEDSCPLTHLHPSLFTSGAVILWSPTCIYHVCCQIFLLRNISGGIKFLHCFSPHTHRFCF